MEGAKDPQLQRQVDELMARLASNDDRFRGLEDRADASEVRADAAEHRADAAHDRADALEKRAEAAHHRADVAEGRADAMEAHAQIDHEMIAELQADGVLSQKHAADMELALLSSRTIGAAVGILMASRHLSQDEAFTVLKEASQRSNRKLRDLAAELMEATTRGVPL